MALKVYTKILYCDLYITGIQCKEFKTLDIAFMCLSIVRDYQNILSLIVLTDGATETVFLPT